MGKILLLFLVILIAIGFAACTMEKSAAETVEKQMSDDKPKTDERVRKPVLVELFTSEG